MHNLLFLLFVLICKETILSTIPNSKIESKPFDPWQWEASLQIKQFLLVRTPGISAHGDDEV